MPDTVPVPCPNCEAMFDRPTDLQAHLMDEYERDWESIATHLAERDEAWKKLVIYLIEEGGFAPPYEARGLWVDLYDEATEHEGTNG